MICLHMADSTFVQHTSCPKCGSRDNLGEYTDHVYCFGCGYHSFVASSGARSMDRTRHTSSNSSNSIVLPPDYDSHIPKLGLEWLNKYKLTPQEIYGNRIGWSECGVLVRGTLVFAPCLLFPVYDPYGQLLMWQGRYFGEDKDVPKYYTRGGKDLLHILGRKNKGEHDEIVLTEDLISAIKVSRVTRAMPIFGSGVNQTLLVRLLSQTDSLCFWLDADKEKEARRYLKRASQWFRNVRVVATPLDPKEYDTEAIKAFLKS